VAYHKTKKSSTFVVRKLSYSLGSHYASAASSLFLSTKKTGNLSESGLTLDEARTNLDTAYNDGARRSPFVTKALSAPERLHDLDLH
jgi:hypothetical protein